MPRYSITDDTFVVEQKDHFALRAKFDGLAYPFTGESDGGQWETISDEWLQYDPIENGFQVSTRQGETFTAKFDGKRWPNKHDKEVSWDSVQFIRIDDSSFYDIKYKGDVVAMIYRANISSDGNELRIEALDAKSGHLQPYLFSRTSVEGQSGLR